MRNSDWKITWDPAGDALVLLDYDDLMDSEIRMDGQQLVEAGKSDFAVRAVFMSRGNSKRRLEFTRRIEHATGAASWNAWHAALAAVPWGAKASLKIAQRAGQFWICDAAAVLSSSHRLSTEDGIIESVHQYSLRITQPIDD